jgi:hypothetical protein
LKIADELNKRVYISYSEEGCDAIVKEIASHGLEVTPVGLIIEKLLESIHVSKNVIFPEPPITATFSHAASFQGNEVTINFQENSYF